MMTEVTAVNNAVLNQDAHCASSVDYLLGYLPAYLCTQVLRYLERWEFWGYCSRVRVPALSGWTAQRTLQGIQRRGLHKSILQPTTMPPPLLPMPMPMGHENRSRYAVVFAKCSIQLMRGLILAECQCLFPLLHSRVVIAKCLRNVSLQLFPVALDLARLSASLPQASQLHIGTAASSVDPVFNSQARTCCSRRGHHHTDLGSPKSFYLPPSSVSTF